MCMARSFQLAVCGRCSDEARRRCGYGLLRLLNYWEARRGPRNFPARKDIDPLDLADLLPHVFLIDVLEAAPFFRYRLTGTMVDEIHGQNLTGKTPQDIQTQEIAAAVEQQCRQVVQQRGPHCAHVRLIADDQSFWHFERLILPLSDDDRTINMLLCGIYAT